MGILSKTFLFFPRDGDHEMFQQLLAPLFLGLVVNYFLWGVQITQSYYYYRSYRSTDRTWLKAAVALLFVTDLIESICIAQACWNFLVDGWGDLNKVTVFPGWGFYATPLTDSFTASIVHLFYAQKIWTLLDAPYHFICTGIVVVLSGTQLTGGIGGSIYMYSSRMTLAEFSRFKTWACVWLVTAAVTDIVITLLMTWKLSKSRTGFKKTDDMISKLIRLTVETGLATAVVQIVDIIVYLVWPLKSYHLVLAFIAPKVYSNSMLSLLNSRRARDTTMLTWGVSQHTEVPMESIAFRNSQSPASLPAPGNYELEDIAQNGNGKLRSRNDQRSSLAATSVVSLDSTTKLP